MLTVIPKEGESFDSTLSRFTKMVQDSGLLAELKRREFYEKPSDKRRRKQKESRAKMSKKFRSREGKV